MSLEETLKIMEEWDTLIQNHRLKKYLDEVGAKPHAGIWFSLPGLFILPGRTISIQLEAKHKVSIKTMPQKGYTDVYLKQGTVKEAKKIIQDLLAFKMPEPIETI